MSNENTAPTSDVAQVAQVAEVGAGESILDVLAHFLSRFVVWPSEHALNTWTLWLAHCWRMDAWDTTPRAALTSAEKGCGKSTVFEISRHLVPRGDHSISSTPSYIIRSISSEDGPPTVFFDEIDTIFGPKAKGNEQLRGLINGGFRPGATVNMTVTTGNTHTPVKYPSYCAIALGGIGTLPDTISDRAVVIRLRRPKPTENYERFRERKHGLEAADLATLLGEWMSGASFSWPENMPVDGRDADIWEPLVMIADAAGGHWPETARNAAMFLTNAKQDDTKSVGTQLLADIRVVFVGHGKMHQQKMVSELINLPESQWRRYYYNGDPLNGPGLSKLLKEYEISSHQVKIDGENLYGYTIDDFTDAWERFLPSECATNATSATSPVGAPETATVTQAATDTFAVESTANTSRIEVGGVCLNCPSTTVLQSGMCQSCEFEYWQDHHARRREHEPTLGIEEWAKQRSKAQSKTSVT